MRLYSENKELLYEQEITLLAGLNYLNYKGIVKESAIPILETMANKGLKEEDKPVKIKAMEDGQIYIIKGKYNLTFEVNGEKSETTLTLR
jgi:hypothetical protein